MLTARAKGPATLERLGGMAFRAPVLATLFLVIALATLAMPGTPNFVGEILILFGALEDKLVFAVVASLGVALAAVYMIRIFQRSMHNRAGAGVADDRRDVGAFDFAVIAPLVLVIVALGVYPQVMLEPAERATNAERVAGRARGRRRARRDRGRGRAAAGAGRPVAAGPGRPAAARGATP